MANKKTEIVFAKRIAGNAPWEGDKKTIEPLLKSGAFVEITEDEHKALVKKNTIKKK